MSPRHLVAYFGNRYLDHFRRDLEEIVDHGFNGIVHCATEADLEWRLERLGEIFRLTRDAGLECWADPWGVGGVFGGEAYSGFVGRNPDAMQRTSAGSSVPHACLRNLAFTGFMKQWIDGMAQSGAETIFWDEPHLAMSSDEVFTCVCETCTAEFGPFPSTISPEVTEFRVATAKGFLDEMTKHARSKGLRNSVCLYPLEGEAAARMGVPSIGQVSALEAVDDVGVDPYPVFELLSGRSLSDFDAERFVGGWADKLVEVASSSAVTVHIWIQGFLLPEGSEGLVEACAAAARRHGVSDLAFWGYRAAEVTSLIKPGNPRAVWSSARRTFRIASAPLD